MHVAKLNMYTFNYYILAIIPHKIPLFTCINVLNTKKL